MPIEVESPEELGYDTIRFNLSESSVRDATIGELGLRSPSLIDELAKRLLAYGDHRGDPELRALVAARSSSLHGDDVLITAGAAMALFLVHAAFLDPQDDVVVVHPNYATNIETPRALGAKVLPLHLAFKDGYRPDLDRLESLVDARTKILSITDPHNPTGVCLTDDERAHIVHLAERHACLLLVDETYRDLSRGPTRPWAAELSTSAISIASLSKSIGVPGIRIGWAITRNPMHHERLLAAKEQMMICGSVLDETVATHVLRHYDDLLADRRVLAARNFAIVKEWMRDHRDLEWVEPTGGVICFPRMRDPFAFDIDRFYNHLLEIGGTTVGPGHWFEVDRRSFRLGFGWPVESELRSGLAAIDASLVASRIKGTSR